jgi:hypothetical protein
MHCAVSDIPTFGLPILLAGKYVDRSWEYILIAHRQMNVEIRTEATQLLFWEYINGIFSLQCSWRQVYCGKNDRHCSI